MIEIPTRALRAGTPDVLRDGLLRMLIDGEEEWVKDWRDLLVALAPYHDCARRLGVDPVAFFDAVAGVGPQSVGGRVREFGRRTDVTPEAFGYVVSETPDGPRYDWAPLPG